VYKVLLETCPIKSVHAMSSSSFVLSEIVSSVNDDMVSGRSETYRLEDWKRDIDFGFSQSDTVQELWP
jgi:hypothetical protein